MGFSKQAPFEKTANAEEIYSPPIKNKSPDTVKNYTVPRIRNNSSQLIFCKKL